MRRGSIPEMTARIRSSRPKSTRQKNKGSFASAMKRNAWRAMIEVSFIILFYANILMGEFERSGQRVEEGFSWLS